MCTWECMCWQRPGVLDVTRVGVTGFCETPDVVLGIEFWFSGRAAPALDCRATSPSQSLLLFISVSQNSSCQLVKAKWATVRWMNARLQSWEVKIIMIHEFLKFRLVLISKDSIKLIHEQYKLQNLMHSNGVLYLSLSDFCVFWSLVYIMCCFFCLLEKKRHITESILLHMKIYPRQGRQQHLCFIHLQNIITQFPGLMSSLAYMCFMTPD